MKMFTVEICDAQGELEAAVDVPIPDACFVRNVSEGEGYVLVTYFDRRYQAGTLSVASVRPMASLAHDSLTDSGGPAHHAYLSEQACVRCWLANRDIVFRSEHQRASHRFEQGEEVRYL